MGLATDTTASFSRREEARKVNKLTFIIRASDSHGTLGSLCFLKLMSTRACAMQAASDLPAEERDWLFIAEQAASAPHMLRIVPHTAPRVGRSYEHFPDGFELDLLTSSRFLPRRGERGLHL